MRIAIIGAGVSGLTTGVRLLEAGHEVAILTRDLPSATTSRVAGAVWEPYAVEPTPRVTAWGTETYAAFKALAPVAGAGVRMADALALSRARRGAPDWAAAVEDFRFARPEELPEGYVEGYAYSAPVVDMALYLDYLRRRFAGRGVIVQREARSLGEVFDAWAELFGAAGESHAEPQVVVNCAGLAARELVGDATLHPVRGQVLRVVDPTFRRVLFGDLAENPPTYIIPRISDIALGGTFDDRAESLTPDDATRTAILMRCAELALHFNERFAMRLAARVGGDFAARFAARVSPEHRDAPPIALSAEADGCGLRPARATIRLAREELAPDRLVIHNYGHGGAGVTLSWGCAGEVARLIASAG